VRKTKQGTKNLQDWNIQDHDRLNLSPTEKALWKFRQWAAIRPTQGYYDDLPPAAQMAVSAVAAVLDTLTVPGGTE
jgi:hypothetical protein